MNHLDLFSGIGGFALAASWVWGAEHKIVSFCEIDPFCQKVLTMHWPNVPIQGDIKKMKGDCFETTIDILTGGFPCQPYSFAGKRRGAEDDRALWPEMFRIIKEAKPRWVIGENVVGFANLGLDDCLSDLESKGYDTTAFIIPACSVKAPHRRDRVWIVANQHGNRCDKGREGIAKAGGNGIIGNVRTFTNQQKPRLERRNTARTGSADGWDSEHAFRSIWEDKTEPWNEPWLEAATRLCGMDDGLSDRVHKLKSLGNAIVPQVVVPIMQAIKKIDEMGQ